MEQETNEAGSIAAGISAAFSEAVALGGAADQMLVGLAYGTTRFGLGALGPAHVAACYAVFIGVAEAEEKPQDEVPILLTESEIPAIENLAAWTESALRNCVARGLPADLVLQAATGALMALSNEYLGAYGPAIRWTRAQLQAIESRASRHN